MNSEVHLEFAVPSSNMFLVHHRNMVPRFEFFVTLKQALKLQFYTKKEKSSRKKYGKTCSFTIEITVYNFGCDICFISYISGQLLLKKNYNGRDCKEDNARTLLANNYKRNTLTDLLFHKSNNCCEPKKHKNVILMKTLHQKQSH